MLHPKQNRIDYGEQLIPPNGYEFIHAIGTTYSLDLEALMLLPIALFYAKKIEGTSDELRYDMLDAITKAAEKITIFYHNSQLKVPSKYHHLMAYWEKGIQAVSMPHYASSFHPKVWIVRYESEDNKPMYRFINTSRNLTFSRDWDVAFSTQGIVTNSVQEKNKPLIHFLKYLSRYCKHKIPKSFAEDLLKVKFDLPDKFEELNFYPIGIKDPETDTLYSNPLTSKSEKWNKLLLVSPFLDNKTLTTIRQSVSTKPTLCSRRDQLEKMNSSVLERYTPFEFNTYFSNAEFMQDFEEDGVVPTAQNLHAKLYVALLSKVPHWYLGSANCSEPAQKRNIEFLVELKGQNIKGLRTKDVVRMLTDPEKADGAAIFNPYMPGEKKGEEDLLLIGFFTKKMDCQVKQIFKCRLVGYLNCFVANIY
ncbi:MAG: phospholipase D family protein [Prolixibacteraceae bacterium]|nr:phospholipase D family protein [Prolixibacteraceae bacterium]